MICKLIYLMIISHRYKFIFLKTNKTASTSVEIALSKFCGPNDIITPISPKDENIRTELKYPGPQNYQSCLDGNNIYYNHISAKKVKSLIGEEIWRRYYKFCFERNPWDRVVSLYFWLCRSKLRPSLAQFIQSGALLRLKRKGSGVYRIKGEIAVDKVCLFENIYNELKMLQKEVGITGEMKIPSTKSHFRKDRRSYRDILSNDDRRIVEEIFSEEIKEFNYRW